MRRATLRFTFQQATQKYPRLVFVTHPFIFHNRYQQASWTGPDNSDVKEIKGKIASPMKNPRNKRREEVSNF
ncbi:hypothetical protein D5086_008088 [Populus alba]|uniref:Uncharacterized protein n=1 Tax=Populus alba TaxID=43335 RepID=A0ACC4CG26_POPAL